MKRSWDAEFGYPDRFVSSLPPSRYPRLDSKDLYQGNGLLSSVDEFSSGHNSYYGRPESEDMPPRRSSSGRSGPGYINPEYYDKQHSSQFEGVSRGNQGSSIDGLTICVDFVRGVCQNGARCPKAHIDYVESIDDREVIAKVKFCHNFQNKGVCNRPSGCNFLHVTRYEEDEFLLIGRIPRSVFERASSSESGPSMSNRGGRFGGAPRGRQGAKPTLVNNISYCIDFLKGTCVKTQCSLRHVESVEDETDRFDIVANVFCHDYLNNKCKRKSCKYVHADRNEEQYFMANGYFPPSTNARNHEKMFMTDVCLDNLRNQCIRGKKCNFKHVDQIEDTNERKIVSRSVFCHDFQDGQCQRPYCKLLHAKAQDEAHFLTYGRVPEYLSLASGRRDPGLDRLAKEVCRDFIKNKCTYGEGCKFYHPEAREIEALVKNSKTSDKQHSNRAPQYVQVEQVTSPSPAASNPGPEMEMLIEKVEKLEKLLGAACQLIAEAVGNSCPGKVASLLDEVAELGPATHQQQSTQDVATEDVKDFPTASGPNTSQTDS